MTITQLKTELREFIALSETITPGEWIRNYGHNPSITLTDYETDIAIVWSKREYHSQDATFIALKYCCRCCLWLPYFDMLEAPVTAARLAGGFNLGDGEETHFVSSHSLRICWSPSLNSS